MQKPDIVLVHGLFVTRHCWDPWVERFRARGHGCIAPAYPARELTARELRERHPDPATAAVTLPQVIERFSEAIREFERPPILIGHSFGGLLVQLLLQRRLGACGVAIDSVAPAGVISLKPSYLWSLLPPLNPLASAASPYLMSPRHFRFAFCNAQTPEASVSAWEEQAAPESRRLARSGLSAMARVDFGAARAPLLLIAGSRDNIMPASLNRSNWRRYRRSGSITDFQEFAGRDHYLIGAPGWEEVADYALEWALAHAESGMPSARAARTANGRTGA